MAGASLLLWNPWREIFGKTPLNKNNLIPGQYLYSVNVMVYNLLCMKEVKKLHFMSFANLGNIFVPEVQARGASNNLKILVNDLFSKMFSWLLELSIFLTLYNFDFRDFQCFHVYIF